MQEIDEEEEECEIVDKNKKAVKLEKDLVELSLEEKEKVCYFLLNFLIIFYTCLTKYIVFLSVKQGRKLLVVH